jgi:hypothetical protein
MPAPLFAVLGHPNKGKSSIVATLAHDDSVAIGPAPGTTVKCRYYPMKVDGRELYTLVDTPGFQRARGTLEWMREHESTAARHAEVVRAFVETFRGKGFDDECELLTPVVAGAGILYVVDGSVPYGPEYEPEMEILRWTGRPRMALVNPIGRADFVEEWREALGQFFSVVRVFNAWTAEFPKQVELLRTFGHLEESWNAPLAEAVRVLEQQRARHRTQAARTVAEQLVSMLSLVVTRDLPHDAAVEPEKPLLEQRYREQLRRLEQQSRDRVERLYDHQRLQRLEDELGIVGEDLFSESTWLRFGLEPRQLALLGAGGGAFVGGTVDAALGGASFLLGTLIGAGVGAVAALLGADRLVEVKIASVAMGGKRLSAGPTRNRNFPHVVFGRARLHYALVSGRSHARRDDLDCRASAEELLPPLGEEVRRELEQRFEGIRRGSEPDAVEGLARAIDSVFAADEQRGAVSR